MHGGIEKQKIVDNESERQTWSILAHRSNAEEGLSLRIHLLCQFENWECGRRLMASNSSALSFRNLGGELGDTQLVTR